jgi:hypothetical protein
MDVPARGGRDPCGSDRAATAGVAHRLRRYGTSLTVLLAASAAFGVLVTSNSAGYRYGVSDQAFYIPAILQDISPRLFPRDAALLDPQSRLTVIDEAVAWLCRATDDELADLFFAGYLATVVLFTAGVLLVGGRLYGSPWTVVALGLALTLRHRIASTGVNTFEGYFHPRVLAFAIGLIAVGAALHGRRRLACLLAATAVLVHPTAGLMFVVWMGGAVLAAAPARAARLALAAGVVALSAVTWLSWRGRLVVMDAAWVAALSEKDYLFWSDWPAGAWATNVVAPAVLIGLFVARRRCHCVSDEERTVFTGAVLLLGLCAASLPFVEARVALAVQLQTTRVLWPIELLATAYLVWALAEAPWARWRVSPAFRTRALIIALALASTLRGAYVLRVEHERPLVAIDLPATDWQQVGDWAARHTAADAHFLVDPGHAWKYGVSFRIAGQRDVVLEHVKDAAVATYSRDVALRVDQRARSIGDFGTMTAERAEALARAYDVDYLVVERALPLPLVYANGRFRVYALDE